jgi:hypothetical protein
MSEKYEKIFLHDDGEDVESCWAEPASAVKNGRVLVRLANIPFLYPKPTYGDVIEVARDAQYGGAYAWDRTGLPWSRIGERIHKDGRRYTGIVDYEMGSGADFGALAHWLKSEHDIVAEGGFTPEDDRPGRLYLAIPDEVELDDILDSMDATFDGFTFSRVYPPSKKKRPTAKKKRAAKKKSSPKKKRR